MKNATLNTARAAGVSIAALGLVALGAGAASAHVTVTPSTTAAGGYSVLTFSLSHGCDGSSTTKVAIQMPEDVITVAPTLNGGWSVKKDMQKLDKPVDDGHGGEYTERVKQVVYTAKAPLADGYRDSFELSLQLPESEGDTMAFPTIQTCEKGETAWIQTAAEGEDEPESPAPAFTLTAAEGDGHGHSDDSDEDEADHGDEADKADKADKASADGGSDTLGWTGIGVGALGLVAGSTALVRSRKSA